MRRHIFGRGRSCVPLKAPHTRSFTSGSNASQYVVLRQGVGMPVVEPVHVSPRSFDSDTWTIFGAGPLSRI